MLSRSTLYNNIFANQNHSVEWKISINGTDYGMDDIAADAGGGSSLPHIHRQLFTGSSPAVGGCVSATFECSIFEASANVPRMAVVVPSYRLTTEMQSSEWIQLGVFYIDTRSVDEASGILNLSCYDRMLIADGEGGKTYADVTGFTEWPQSMSAVVNEIAAIMGVTVDSRTTINSGSAYVVDYPSEYTMREVLGYIATAHAGCWTITAENKLRLVKITGNTDTLSLGTNTQVLATSPAFDPWSKVTVYYGDETAFQSGTDTGREMVCDCPWATQGTADGILSVISGTTYQPFSGGGSFIDLALELGDKVVVGYPGETITAPCFTIDITAEVLEVAQISAEGEQEIDHEYPYSDYVDRTLKRKVTLGQSYYGTSISRDKGIEIKRSDGLSEALFNSDVFTMRALVNGIMKDRIYFDPERSNYVFDGVLGADAIYANTGDIAELTVDRLSTSRRIRKYILGDTSDDNYISIQDNYIRFVTGAPVANAILLTQTGDYLVTEDDLYLVLESADYVTTQATNRNGEPLYWQAEPVSHTEDGYPLDENGKQIYASTDETEWPVTIYLYKELVKAQYAFGMVDGVYQPQVVLGAGDENGNSRGYLYKAQTNLLMRYVTSAGKNVDITFNDDGFVDAAHRRLSSCDIDPELGTVTYFVEGDELGHQLTFTVDGDTVTYTWPDGHTCEITIPEDVSV